MAFISRRTIYLLTGLFLGFVLAVGGLIWSGLYNVGADDPHIRPIYAVLEVARDRSIVRRASAITVPSLDDSAQVIQGAGNYNAMCTGCHLTPGSEPTELSRGLYPAPPNLSLEAVDPAEAFWVIKHGIKASGMPAWGQSMEDTYIWNMVAFLQVLPKLDAAGYQDLVGKSSGHSHGGGESDGHAHSEMADAAMPGMAHAEVAMPHDEEPTGQGEPAAGGPQVHEHADGSLHDHAPAAAKPAPVPPAPEVPTAPVQEEPASPTPPEHDDSDDHHH